MCLPAVVRLIRGFWDDTRYRTEFEKLPFVMSQLTLMTVWYLISTVELRDCNMREQDAERLVGVLGITSEKSGQRGLQEFWDSGGSWCTSISVEINSEQPGRILKGCWYSAQ